MKGYWYNKRLINSNISIVKIVIEYSSLTAKK